MMKEAEVKSRFDTVWVTIVLGGIILAGTIWLIVSSLTDKVSNADLRGVNASQASEIATINTKIEAVEFGSSRLENESNRLDALYRHLDLEWVRREGGGIEVIKARRGRWE